MISIILAAALAGPMAPLNEGDETEAVGVLTVAAIRGCAVSPACRKLVGRGIAYGGSLATGAAGSAMWDGVKISYGWWKKDAGGPVKGQMPNSGDQ